jgi:large subunit ribosomal protein L9
MKVILADDVRGLGHRGDTVAVKPGYARNFLFPQGLAWEATPGNARRLTEEKKKYDDKNLREKAVAEEASRKIEGLRITITKKAGEGDVLYGSVTPTDIADALGERGVEVDRRRIEVAEPIKRLGEHTVHVRLHRDVVAELIVEVQPVTVATA